MIIEVTLPDEYQGMIDVVMSDVEKDNPDHPDITIDGVLAQVCRKYIVDVYAQHMLQLEGDDQ